MFIIYLLAWLLDVKLDWRPLSLLGVAAAVVLGASLFSTFSLIIACLVRTRERFMGVGQVLTMPLFFASNAIYPLEMMPGWLRVVARMNPLTYEVDALRSMMLAGGVSVHGIGPGLPGAAGGDGGADADRGCPLPPPGPVTFLLFHSSPGASRPGETRMKKGWRRRVDRVN